MYKKQFTDRNMDFYKRACKEHGAKIESDNLIDQFKYLNSIYLKVLVRLRIRRGRSL